MRRQIEILVSRVGVSCTLNIKTIKSNIKSRSTLCNSHGKVWFKTCVFYVFNLDEVITNSFETIRMVKYKGVVIKLPDIGNKQHNSLLLL